METEVEEIKVGVIGLGHVGLVTALGLAEMGWSVVGTDHDQAKAAAIAQGKAPFYEPGLVELLHRQISSLKFQVVPSVECAVKASSVVFVCVGTPQMEDGSADLSQLEQVSHDIAASLDGYKIIVEKSTAPVRTAQALKSSILRYHRFMKSGEAQPVADPVLDVAVNPEFLREGTALKDFFHPDRIVLGVSSERARQVLLRLYQPLTNGFKGDDRPSVVVTDLNTAEIIKHASNAFLATKISFINMVANLCENTGADVATVSSGLGMDPRIGPAFLQAGIGFGGYCLPKDLRAFIKIGDDHGVNMSLLREVEQINLDRAERFLAKIKQAVWVVRGKTLGVWGLAFKPGTDDVRDACSLRVVSRLLDEGTDLRLYDPQAMDQFRKHFPDNPPRLTYCASALESVEGADALLVLTEWPEFLNVGLAQVRELMKTPVVVDGRNLYGPNVVRESGFEYFSMGRT